MGSDLISREAVLDVLTDHIGAHRGISARSLARAIVGDLLATAATERRLRSTIEMLRKEGHHICGTPADGYFMAATDVELIGTCEFLYARAMTSIRQISAMRRVSLPDLRGQLRLPT